MPSNTDTNKLKEKTLITTAVAPVRADVSPTKTECFTGDLAGYQNRTTLDRGREMSSGALRFLDAGSLGVSCD